GTYRDAGMEASTLRAHLRQPPVEMALLHPELGNPVPQEPADAVVPLVHRDRVPGPGELLCAGQARRARAHNGDGLARRARRWPWRDVAVLPGPVGDDGLDVLDRHRGLADGQHAGRLAGGGAEPPGELGKVVGGVQPLARGRPVASPDEIVPFRDEVPQRTAVVTERDAAVHAASCLRPDDRQQASPVVDLVPVPHPLLDGAAGTVLARGCEEALWVSHGALQRQKGDLGPDDAVLDSPYACTINIRMAGPKCCPADPSTPTSTEPIQPSARRAASASFSVSATLSARAGSGARAGLGAPACPPSAAPSRNGRAPAARAAGRRRRRAPSRV